MLITNLKRKLLLLWLVVGDLVLNCLRWSSPLRVNAIHPVIF